jgi:ankyrin repeat protein
VSIGGDGTVRYKGQAFVLIPGDHVAHITPDAVRELVRKFEQARFFSARDSYVAGVTDNPTYTLTLTVSGQKKTVVDYVGQEAGLPLAIKDLEDAVDEAAGTERWVKGNGETVTSLVAENWPFAASTSQNLAVYSSAISKHFAPLVQQYVAAGGPAYSPDGKEDSPVCIASENGDLDLVRNMLKLTAKSKLVGFPARVANECLASAAEGGNVEVLQFWLKKGGDPKAAPAKRETRNSGLGVLAKGISSCNPEIVGILLKSKPDLHALVNEDPILAYALEQCHAEDGERRAQMVEMLIKAGADVNAKGHFGQTPLFDTVFSAEAVKPLIAAGADPEARDQAGNTALIWTAYYEPTVRALLEAGANPNAANTAGETALKRANSCEPCAALIETALKKPALPAAEPKAPAKAHPKAPAKARR